MAEIKISELSIGDWVMFTPDKNIYVAKPRFTSAPAKITGTYCGGEVILEIECHREFMAIPLSCIEPIPISPEILEKNGLEYEDDENDAVIFLCCDMFWARLCVGDTFWQVGIHNEDRLDAVVCDVKHTHQLQHALRLAGVKKEIEL